MTTASERLTQQVITATLKGGANVVGVADLSATLADPPLRPVYALVFGLRYPDSVVERLPDDADIILANAELGAAASRIYALVEPLLLGSGEGVRSCRYDAVERTFDALRHVLSQKAVAALAGLGWIGKASLLVTPTHGPRLRLGTLFTDARLLPDAPWPTNACGVCHACRDTCPVGAVTEEALSFGGLVGYRIAAARCRVFLERHAPALGRNEFCGLCLKVCPFGRLGG
jgi:epoxyqueuosine reductase QueG